MRANNVLGLIFSNTFDSYLSEITSVRSMGSVPYGCRYRLIDFQLSAMVNSGMSKVGIITKSNYQSLMDHVGHGRAWDLSRKNGGLYLLPPFNIGNTGIYSNKIEAISSAMNFLRNSEEEYVLMTDCNAIYNVDLSEMFNRHEATGADITVAYKRTQSPAIKELSKFELDGDGRITSVSRMGDGEANCSLNVIFMRKSLLERLISEAIGLGYRSFTEDVLQKNIKSLKIFGYEFDGYVKIIDGIQSYFEANMELLKKENRKALFSNEKPVFTKVKDDVPAIYGLDSQASNSLIADGCVIEGTVENSVLFRGVHIGKGAVVKNCVLMQNTYISDNVKLNCVIADKNVVIKPDKNLSGDVKFPVFIGKGIVI